MEAPEIAGLPRAGTPEHTTGHVIRDSSLGLAPETLPALLDLQAAIWHRSSVGPALLEVLRLRNARTVNCVFCKSVRYDIARADGLTEAERGLATFSIAFGRMTWPHMMARAMLAEQLWRATSILANHPYHREG